MTDVLSPGSLPPARPPRIRLGLWHVLMLFVSVLFLVPLASMIIGSLRLPGLPPPRGMEWMPEARLAWGNYPAVFQLIELGRYLVNTLVVEALAVPVTLLVGSWAGFALAQLPVRIARRIIERHAADLVVARNRALGQPLYPLPADQPARYAHCPGRAEPAGDQPALCAHLLLELPPGARRGVGGGAA